MSQPQTDSQRGFGSAGGGGSRGGSSGAGGSDAGKPGRAASGGPATAPTTTARQLDLLTNACTKWAQEKLATMEAGGGTPSSVNRRP